METETTINHINIVSSLSFWKGLQGLLQRVELLASSFPSLPTHYKLVFQFSDQRPDAKALHCTALIDTIHLYTIELSSDETIKSFRSYDFDNAVGFIGHDATSLAINTSIRTEKNT